jgi:ABC-2 type transport system permease protein
VRTGLILAFYATPIIYNIGLMPLGIREFLVFNPLAGVFELFRFSLLNQGEINLKILSLNVMIITIFVILGIYTFNKEKNFFVDWI